MKPTSEGHVTHLARHTVSVLDRCLTAADIEREEGEHQSVKILNFEAKLSHILWAWGKLLNKPILLRAQPTSVV